MKLFQSLSSLNEVGVKIAPSVNDHIHSLSIRLVHTKLSPAIRKCISQSSIIEAIFIVHHCFPLVCKKVFVVTSSLTEGGLHLSQRKCIFSHKVHILQNRQCTMQSGHCTGSHSVPFFTQLSFVNLVCCLHSIHTFHPLISEDSWARMYRITDFQTLLLMHRALHRHIMHNALRVLHAHTHRSSQPFKRFFLIVSAVSKLCV